MGKEPEMAILSLSEHLSCNERWCSKNIPLPHALFTFALEKCYGSAWDWRLARQIPMDYHLNPFHDESKDWTLLSTGRGYGVIWDQLT